MATQPKETLRKLAGCTDTGTLCVHLGVQLDDVGGEAVLCQRSGGDARAQSDVQRRLPVALHQPAQLNCTPSRLRQGQAVEELWPARCAATSAGGLNQPAAYAADVMLRKESQGSGCSENKVVFKLEVATTTSFPGCRDGGLGGQDSPKPYALCHSAQTTQEAERPSAFGAATASRNR